jgi:hypothetical protein
VAKLRAWSGQQLPEVPKAATPGETANSFFQKGAQKVVLIVIPSGPRNLLRSKRQKKQIPRANPASE